MAKTDKEYLLISLIEVNPIKIEINLPYGVSNIDSVLFFTNTESNIAKLKEFDSSVDILNYHNLVNRPGDIFKITVESGEDLIPGQEFDVWRNGDEILFSRPIRNYYGNSSISFVKIPLNIIEYYRIEGDVSYEDKISGGGGGGSDYGKALVGGLLFGATGAIIASRNDIQEVKSEHIVHDKRVLVLSIIVNNTRRRLTFKTSVIDIFNLLMPEKYYDTIALQNSASVSPTEKATSIPEQILQLSKLHEMGILTSDEFADAKKILLTRLATL